VFSEPLKANMRDARAREAELLAVVQLASASPLEKVSWLRADGEEPIEYSIERDAQGIPADINVLGANQVEEQSTPDAQSGRVPALSGFASMLAKAASSTTLHAAVVMLLISDSSALSFPVPSLFTKPALLATGVALGLGYRTLPF
jgi:hypothetical protein